jgi:transcription initiation factor TFIIB
MPAAEGQRCVECGERVVSHGDEDVCEHCGLVADADRMDRGPDWRRSDDGEVDGRHTGAPLTRARHDRGLSTEMGQPATSGRKRRRQRRLRRQHRRTTIGSKADRNRVWAFTEVRRLADVLGVPESIRDRACVLFERAQNRDLLRGRSIEGVAAAALYAACRLESVSRTIDEVVDAAKADADELQVAYDALNRDLELPVEPADPREYLPRFASALDCPASVERRATELAADAREAGIVDGRHPGGVAAACLYAAARAEHHPLTQQAAADVADVTPVTVRNTYQDLVE